MSVHGDLRVLEDRHVATIIGRKGYQPVLDRLWYELHVLSGKGVEWQLHQHRTSYGSWSLAVEGMGFFHLRARRPYDGVVYLLNADRVLVGKWATPEQVSGWFASVPVVTA